ncbi:putative secreted protein [Corynebacterium diphtheriae HC01]|uniref:DUF3068 domain-containing protein n=1 Tax=Corynebacterium diphtheriae TaxID=1717 RepID=UPI000245B3CD|nr:DUF3068 domain-containing protein [Corynebacterium diphtheriae]AEX43448.1 putative secreted protein [Corynebacterium diphtheriae 241]AEX73636.1 putative secreted protein [Corynebacterium diphtheriae HC01]CAB0491799.1 hypothetical protein CIP100161_00328 [Corynebacterium diphtheriae]CAB0492268.1 hypothetical protein CIP102550_00344 [Corynebacterium diphtheriae]CAB0585349.1 hypothetical protein CIP107549_00441 [Corynebacterium diphtheriae]
MLPTTRILSVLLLGLGVALVAVGILAPRWVNTDARLPLDLSQTTFTLVDDHARTRLINDGRVLDAGVVRQWHMDILPPTDADTATVRIGVTDVRKSRQADVDRLIQASVWTYPLDRLSGEALAPATVSAQLGSPTESVPVDGAWLKFPSDAQQTTYEVFDPTLRSTTPAVFSEEIDRGGRTIYRYNQEIKPTNVAEKYASVFNTTQRDENRLYLYHSGNRQWYVDQISGLVVDVEENIEDYFGDADGTRREDALIFHGRMSEDDKAALFGQASAVSDGSVARVLYRVALAAGAVLSVVGLMGAFRRRPVALH